MPKTVQVPEIYSLYLQFIELEHVYKLSKDRTRKLVQNGNFKSRMSSSHGVIH